jgi:hypothetical protein
LQAEPGKTKLLKSNLPKGDKNVIPTLSEAKEEGPYDVIPNSRRKQERLPAHT